jgi:hypothetical protein
MSWNIYLDDRLIDTVWYTKGCDADYVRCSLINHDGLPYNIEVRAAK